MKYICQYCGKEFSDGKKLGGHITHCSKNPNRVSLKGKKSKCRTNIEQYVKEMKLIHGDHFNYDKAYINKTENGTYCENIFCNKHNIYFSSLIKLHRDKYTGQCPECKKERQLINHNAKLTLDKFKFRIKEKGYDKLFDYPNLDNEYIDAFTPISIICKKHQILFKTDPTTHLRRLKGECPECKNELKNKTHSKEEWLLHVKKIFNNKYEYPNIDNEWHGYSNSIITIICPIHGEFKQSAALHYRGSQCKYCVGGGNNGVSYFKKDKLNILTEYDLLSMHWSVILDLIGEDKLPNEFKCLCKFGENTPERKKMIDDLKETYNIETTDEEEISEVENNIDDSIETEVNDINSEDNIYNKTDENIELNPLKEIKDIGSLLNKDNEDIFSTGDKWLHIIRKQMNKLWCLILRDNENHNENTINEIHQKLVGNSLTKFEKYVYEEFLKEYEEVINSEIH